MRVILDVHAIDWDKRSTYPLETVVFDEEEPDMLLYGLAGFLTNGDGEYQIVIKRTKVER